MASLAAAYPENPIARSPSDALRQLTRRQSECLVGDGQCKEGKFYSFKTVLGKARYLI